MYVSLGHTEKDVDQTIDVSTEVISELKQYSDATQKTTQQMWAPQIGAIAPLF
jgi:hypothetical protein